MNRVSGFEDIGYQLRISNDVEPGIVVLRIAIEDAADLVRDHFECFFLVVAQIVPLRRAMHGTLDFLGDNCMTKKNAVTSSAFLEHFFDGGRSVVN